jgi:hypothetical protein
MTGPAPSTVICVLGMHRSGTSCLTGSLQQGGLELGKHHTWNRFNQKGNRENQDIVDFHDRVLADNGGAWDQPPRSLRFTAEHRRSAQAIIDEFEGSQRWGFKDPRTGLVLELWQQLLPQLQYVGIFRHPLAVVASLQNRSAGEMSRDKALQLWYRYNKILYRQHRRSAFPVMCFDWEAERFHRRLNQIHEELSLRPLGTDERFYTEGLQNFSADQNAGLPWKVRRLYRKLLQISDTA